VREGIAWRSVNAQFELATGAIIVKVVDEQGGMLPGVSVTGKVLGLR